MDKPKKISRRDFIKSTAMGVAGAMVVDKVLAQSIGAPFKGSVLGANDRINMGFIGVGNRGTELLKLFLQEKNNCRIAALCDVYKPYLDRDLKSVDPRLTSFSDRIPAMGETFESVPVKYSDYRKLLENKEIDAVCVATPDHWHALITIDAVNAGKDVYCEKPLTATIYEGRKMVEAQAKTGRVVAVGLNRRGCPIYQQLAKEIPAGKIGKVSVAGAYHISNMFPDGIGSFPSEMLPAGFDWDMWLGPRPAREWKRNIAPYFFRWHHEFSSQMGNWGVHFMDVIRWMLGEQAPVAVTATGGKYVLKDDRDIPDTMQVIFEFKSGVIVNFAIYEATSGSLFQDNKAEVELRGTKGILTASESGYAIRPTTAGQNQKWSSDKLMEAENFSMKGAKDLADGSSANSTQTLVRNFLECVKSRRTPLCTLEDGHRSTSFAHLANISLAMGSRLEWDPEKELFTNNDKANRMLHYDYRKPWKLNI